MSISYSKELKAWDLNQATEDEKEQLLLAGMSYLTQRLGARVLEVGAQHYAEEEALKNLPPEGMAQA
jgi:hypothetical protein